MSDKYLTEESIHFESRGSNSDRDNYISFFADDFNGCKNAFRNSVCGKSLGEMIDNAKKCIAPKYEDDTPFSIESLLNNN